MAAHLGKYENEEQEYNQLDEGVCLAILRCLPGSLRKLVTESNSPNLLPRCPYPFRIRLCKHYHLKPHILIFHNGWLPFAATLHQLSPRLSCQFRATVAVQLCAPVLMTMLERSIRCRFAQSEFRVFNANHADPTDRISRKQYLLFAMAEDAILMNQFQTLLEVR